MRLLPITLIALASCTPRNNTQENLIKPIVNDEFIDYLTIAHEYLTEQQEICQEEYGLGSYERWWYDQETGFLDFLNGDTLKVRIKYQEVGSVSKTSNTWLWAWDNPHLTDKIKQDSYLVKDFGEERGFLRLTKRKWEADEIDGWEMTAIAAYFLKAKGAYRVESENVYAFYIFKEIELIE